MAGVEQPGLGKVCVACMCWEKVETPVRETPWQDEDMRVLERLGWLQ